MSKLKILPSETNSNNRNYPGGKNRRVETQSYFERLWLTNPQQFNPLRNCMEKERLNRTVELIKRHISLEGKKAADLGCGYGELTRRLRDLGAELNAVDIAENALKEMRKNNITHITLSQDYIPSTRLNDDSYDLVMSTELIGDLHPDEYRLFFSELTRLQKPEGKVVGSTSLDIDSQDALQKFAELVDTEMEVNEWVFSYHRLFIRLKDFLKAPARFYKASQDPEYRFKQLQKRRSKWWFKINSSKGLVLFWLPVRALFTPFLNLLKNNRTLLIFLEKLSKALFGSDGISHAIFIGERRKIFQGIPKEDIPREMKHKKQVWE